MPNHKQPTWYTPGQAVVHRQSLLVFLGAVLAALAHPGAIPKTRADDIRTVAETIEFRECTVLAPRERTGRSAFHRDAVEFQIVTGAWKPPRAGDVVKLPDGSERKWEVRKADKDGAFSRAGPNGSYAYFSVPCPKEQVMLLEAKGHGLVYVNGEPRVGDPYGYGYVKLPVLLKQGTNDFLFQLGRGAFMAKLVPARANAMLNASDSTLPDLVVGKETEAWGALVVINASTEPLQELGIEASYAGHPATRTAVPVIPPLSTRKVAFRLKGSGPKTEGKCSLEIKLVGPSKNRREPIDTASLEVSVQRPDKNRKCTFISAVDGSVQYFAWVPAKVDPAQGTKKTGLVLTLHGAGVEAVGQAACFAPKEGVHVIAPTNRRPYGFDWEDWGRQDALEVLEEAQKRLHPDPERIYLTGHSMGGHGTWHLGVIYPDRFAAIGPSAGWVSMSSYAGAARPEHPDPIEEMFLRAAAPSDTLALSRNLKQEGVFILHGDKDTNVPVQQARLMRQHLGGLHSDFVYYEKPGAEHWWGNPCVDWPPMMDFFSRHTIPALKDVQQVEFATVSPAVSARNHWVSIEAQNHALRLSTVNIRLDRDKRLFSGKTENVARLALDVSHLPARKSIQVELDGQKLPACDWPADQRLWLTQTDAKWSVAAPPSPSAKGPHRYGPFKEAFGNRVLLVVGTHGTPEENAWAAAKARYDAETFCYRGNGSIDIVTDEQFDPSGNRDRNLVLYGNAETNSAWKDLLSDSPVQVRRHAIQFGKSLEEGDDLACIFIRPRPGSDRALVGVVSGTGLVGMRVTERLPYFVSGVGYPDCVIAAAETLAKGSAGVRLAGFFGQDWSIATGDFVSTKPR